MYLKVVRTLFCKVELITRIDTDSIPEQKGAIKNRSLSFGS